MRPCARRSDATTGLLGAAAVALLSISPLETAVAQRSIDLPATVGCAACRIVAQRTAVISDETTAGEALDGPPFSMARAGDGEVYFISAQFRPLVYSPAKGTLRQFGRRGSGPGEFKVPTRLFIRADGHLVLLDPPQLRLSVLTAQARPVSTRRLPGKMAPEAVLLDDSILVYNASFNSPESIGFPFHTVGADGRIIRSFGPEVEIRRPEDAVQLRRRLTPSRGTRFWAARELRYEITEWTATGQRVRTITRHPAWFPGADQFEGATPSRPFTPFVTALRAADDDKLWVLIAVPGRNYVSGLGSPTRGQDGVERYPIASHALYYDTVLEVIDLSSASVLASHRLPGYFAYFLDDHFIANYDEAEDGTPRVELWRFDLTGQPL